jgi:hypothetical protein
MASGNRFVCDYCELTIEAWSDGNPYFLDEHGKKCYAYHPDHEALAKCVGNDSPHLCLACGAEFNVDSRTPNSGCPKCRSLDVADTFELEGRKCPACPTGRFSIDPDFRVIS